MIKMIDLSFTKKMKVHFVPVTIGGDKTIWWSKNGKYFYYPYLMVTPFVAGIDKNRSNMNIPSDTTVIADSGGYQINSSIRKNKLSPIDVIEWQEKIADIALILDYPPHITPDGANRSYDYDYFLKCLEITKKNIDMTLSVYNPDKVKLYGVLQGRNVKFLKKWYEEMQRYDFDGYAISMSDFGVVNTDKLLSVLKMIKELNTNIHILGVSSSLLTLCVSRLSQEIDGMITYDSSSIFSGARWGEYYIDGNRNLRFTKFKKGNIINFLPCDCPVCTQHTYEDLFESYVLRNMHNLYIRVRENIKNYGLATGDLSVFLDTLKHLEKRPENYKMLEDFFTDRKRESKSDITKYF